MTLTWTKENSPRWDADKQRMLGPAELAAVGLAPPAPGEPVANEWWRVTDGGEVAGYGWLDSEWGDARITFVVAPGRRGRGLGAFILEHLEDEAAVRGLNYIYNVVPDYGADVAEERKVPPGTLRGAGLAGLTVPDLPSADMCLFNYFRLVTGRSGLSCDRAGGVPD